MASTGGPPEDRLVSGHVYEYYINIIRTLAQSTPMKVSSWLSENCFCQQLHQSDVCQEIEGEPAPSFFISIVNKWELSRHQTRPYFNR